MSFKKTLATFDAYASLSDDARISTISGAIVTLVSLVLMSVLIVSEVALYRQTEVVEHLTVDSGQPTDKIHVSFDITLPHIPCSLLSVDAMDVSGELQLDLIHHIRKQPLDKDGKAMGNEHKHEMDNHVTHKDPSEARVNDPHYCGSCYGAEDKPGQCCNTCDEVRLAYRNKGWGLDSLKKIEQCVEAGETNEAFRESLEHGNGCRARGYLKVQKVSGNVHFSPGKSFARAHMHVHDMAGFSSNEFNISHRINRFEFGENYPGKQNQLRFHKEVVNSKGGMFMYYAKVVPTTYELKTGKVLSTYQFSVTTHLKKSSVDLRQGLGLTGVFIFYEISPIRVVYSQVRRSSILHLITKVCAIVGGIVTVATLLDRFLYRVTGHFAKQWGGDKLS